MNVQLRALCANLRIEGDKEKTAILLHALRTAYNEGHADNHATTVMARKKLTDQLNAHLEACDRKYVRPGADGG